MSKPAPSTAERVVIVEDDPDLREALSVTLSLAKVAHVAYPSAEAALPHLTAGSHAMLVTDFRLPGMNGLDLLREVRTRAPELPVVVMTAYADARLAVDALKSGACDFLIKPFVPDQLIEVIHRHRLRAGESRTTGQLIAEAAASRAALARCERVAATDATVLLTGESGVGKDVFARHLHDISARAGKPYVAINCAAIPETLLEATLFGHEKGAFTGAAKAQAGKFEQADGGTFFLDEIGEMPIELQAKLLRVLQDRTIERLGASRSQSVDLRIVAATNRDLLERVRAGKFREDLYFRLAVFPIRIAPLRERPEDVLPLARAFLDRYAGTMGKPGARLSRRAEAALRAHPWPGNVRELENAIQRALLLADDDMLEPEHMELISPDGLGGAQNLPLGEGLAAAAAANSAVVPVAANYPPAAQAHPGGVGGQVGGNTASGMEVASENPNPTGAAEPTGIRSLEREHILKVLASVGGNRKQAIALLGISERALRYKIKSYREQGYQV